MPRGFRAYPARWSAGRTEWSSSVAAVAISSITRPLTRCAMSSSSIPDSCLTCTHCTAPTLIQVGKTCCTLTGTIFGFLRLHQPYPTGHVRCETETGPAAIVGIGINLTEQSFPSELAAQATSIESATGVRPNPESLLGELLKTLNERYESLRDDADTEPIIRDWCARSSYAFDRHVRVSIAGESFEGVTRRLESDGALRVETDNGRLRLVRAGDVTSVRSTK